MKNVDEIVKKILKTIKEEKTPKIQGRRILTEQNLENTVFKYSSLFPSGDFLNYADKFFAKQTETTVPNPYLNKLVSCADGKTLALPASIVGGEFGKDRYSYTKKTLSTTEYFEWHNYARKKNDTNDITACEYYAEIQRQKKLWNGEKIDNIDNFYLAEFAKCFSECVNTWNNLTEGCQVKFSLESKFVRSALNINVDEESQPFPVYLYRTDWFLSSEGYRAYQAFENVNKFLDTAYDDTEELAEAKKQNVFPLVKSPAEIQRTGYHYSIENKGSFYLLDIDEINPLSSDLYNQKAGETDVLMTRNYNKDFDTMSGMPWKDSEVNSFTENVSITNDGQYIGKQSSDLKDNQPWCVKNNETRVNLRKTPGVNMDTGLLDIASLGEGWDNYIGWTSDRLIGVPTGSVELLYMPIFSYYTASETMTAVISPIETENVKKFITDAYQLLKNKKQKFIFKYTDGILSGYKAMFKGSEPPLYGSIFKYNKDVKSGVVDESTEEEVGTVFNYLYGYLTKSDTGVSSEIKDFFSSLASLGTTSGTDLLKVKDNLVIGRDDIMKLALENDIAKYWIQIELKGTTVKGTNRVWVSQKYVEPCRLGGEKKLTEIDKNMNLQADLYNKLRYPKSDYVYSSDKSVPLLVNLVNPTSQYVEDESLHTNKNSEMMRYLPTVAFKIL